MNSLRMSFWMVPASFSGGTPCSSAATTYSARTGSTAPFIVIDTDTVGQVDAVEQLAHVEDGVDRHPGHPDVALHPRVVGVVTAVGGQVERHRQALLSRGQVAPVEGVRLGGGGEAGVLPDGPRLVDVHRRIRARGCTAAPRGSCPADSPRRPRHPGRRRCTTGLTSMSLRRDPVQLIRGVAVRGRRGRNMLGDSGLGGGFAAALAVQWNVGEAADSALLAVIAQAPNRVSRTERASTASILAVR